MGRVVLLVITLVLCACAATEQPPPDPPSIKPGKGLVYFYRDFDQEGQRTLFTVKENGVVIGTLKAGTFFYHYAEPGRNYYSVTPVGSDTNQENGTFIQVQPEIKHYVQAIPQLNQEGELEALAFVKFREQARSTIDRLTYRETESREEAF